MTQNSGADGKLEARSSSQGCSSSQAHVVHADLAAASALAAADEQRAAALIEIGLGERERLVDAQPGSPEEHDQGAQTAAVRPSPAARMTATISSTFGGSAG